MKIYRCGWCGSFLKKNGKLLNHYGTTFKKLRKYIEEYGDKNTIKMNGECCPNGGSE